MDQLLPGFQPVSRAKQLDPPPFRPFTPRLMYHTQPFDSWLKWFLNVPGIKEQIISWQQKVQSTTEDKVVDIQQSKFSRSFQLKNDRVPSRNELCLTFSVFIDWFNPYSNKLAGRQASMGDIALTCLNLPPHSRNKHNNLYIVGMIPAPKEPNMTTISHILAPLVDELLLLSTSTFVQTPQFPNGHKLSVHLGALIGNIVATHKITGFASHAANFFCSWCNCHKNNMGDMMLHGTRWSELNRLPYWDPVMNVVLGVMHNWYEGILQHHWRVRWAFEPEPSKHNTHDDQLDDWEDYGSDDSEPNQDFHNNALLHIRKVIPSIIVPYGVTQVPPNLGDPKQSLSSDNQNMLLNFLSLVICTNIVSLKSTSDANSKKLEEAYSLYTETSNVVFNNPKIVPNHHYALHLPKQIRWWGSLSNVSKFSGQRVNGILQKMKKNGIIGQIEGTVMREFCQTQRFNSQAPDWSLKPKANMSESKPPRLVKVHPELYLGVLNKLQAKDSTLRNYQDFPHPDGLSVLAPYANKEDSFTSKSGLYISKTKQNRLVAYEKNGHTRYGWVTHIYSLPERDSRTAVSWLQ
ncbi:hypothetical protein PCASD_05234 [Puccinia coronata f. sp. avenae]|uniref:Transposase domain-containing protein n=1 Tax=Puccinia coronata f. sp. avenae TaxID=200324 RepID=A0A2N5TGV7_9BASI|nr:hypothetical protein PCASD_05234 [Puccinia coronata f. sp. avenae]